MKLFLLHAPKCVYPVEHNGKKPHNFGLSSFARIPIKKPFTRNEQKAEPSALLFDRRELSGLDLFFVTFFCIKTYSVDN